MAAAQAESGGKTLTCVEGVCVVAAMHDYIKQLKKP
jgi:hypothetical protein